MTAITLDLNPVATLSHEQFLQLCQTNPDLKLERTAQGELVVMPPTGGETGRINFDMNLQSDTPGKAGGLMSVTAPRAGGFARILFVCF
jgi:hypothetical protein